MSAVRIALNEEQLRAAHRSLDTGVAFEVGAAEPEPAGLHDQPGRVARPSIGPPRRAVRHQAGRIRRPATRIEAETSAGDAPESH